ncbi:MAG: CrcB family protein [Planctomycetes bacterium]|nr:CrcB family protein [Planctomycetota bacterium]
MQLAVVLSVAVAGAFGAVARHLATAWMRGLFGDGPWPVAVVNVVGCFGFGLCWSLLHERVSPTLSVAVLAGFFGAFTTFSAFAFDGWLLVEDRRYGLLVLNVLAQNGLGVASLWLGLTLGARS